MKPKPQVVSINERRGSGKLGTYNAAPGKLIAFPVRVALKRAA